MLFSTQMFFIAFNCRRPIIDVDVAMTDVDVLLPSIFAKYCHERLGVKYISLLSMVGAERGNP